MVVVCCVLVGVGVRLLFVGRWLLVVVAGLLLHSCHLLVGVRWLLIALVVGVLLLFVGWRGLFVVCWLLVVV